MAQLLKGYLYVIASAVIFGCMPLGAKIIYANGVNSISLVFYRNVLAIPAMFLIVKTGKDALRVSRRDFLKLVTLAVLGSVLTPILLYSSYNYISSGASTTLHFVYPAVVILLEVLLFKEKINRRTMVCVILCLAGIVMFYTPDGDTNLFGVALAVLSGVTYAAYIVLLARFDLGHLSGFKYSLYLSGICSAAMLAISVPTGNFTVPANLLCWLVCMVFSLVLCIGAVVLFRQGTLLVGGQRSAILSTFEPITSVVIGIAAFGESLGVRTAIGSVLIILATVLIAVYDTRQK